MNKADETEPSLPSLPSFDALRRGIDALDERIVDLLAERFALAQSFGKDKPLEGNAAHTTLSTAALPALRPQREHQILMRLLARCRERGLPEALILQLWRQLMSTTAFVQRPYGICYLKNDALCLVTLGACFSPHITLLAQESEGEVIAALSQEANTFALVSLSTPHPLYAEEQEGEKEREGEEEEEEAKSVPWWRYLFSTHAPRILQALPSPALPQKNRRRRVLLLGRLPCSFLDEGAAFKYFVVNLKEACAEKKPFDLAQEIHKRVSGSHAQFSLLGLHEKTMLVCCSKASLQSSSTLAELLSDLGEARHIGSTHDDWTTPSLEKNAPHPRCHPLKLL